MKHAVCWVTLATILALNGCKRSDPPVTDEPAAAVAVAPMVLSDEAVDRSELPVKEDFEAAAYAAIDENNLDNQVEALEREIDEE